MGATKLTLNEDSVRFLIEQGIETNKDIPDVTLLERSDEMMFRKVYSEMVRERLKDKAKLDEITRRFHEKAPFSTGRRHPVTSRTGREGMNREYIQFFLKNKMSREPIP